MKKYLKKIFCWFWNERGESASFRTMMVSLNMLLLAFFIALNSVAVQDNEKVKKALGSLIGSFGLLPGGISPMKEQGTGIAPPTLPITKMDMRRYSMIHEIEQYGIDEGIGKGFGIQMVGDNTVLTLEHWVVFDEGSLNISKKVKPFLLKIFELSKDDDYQSPIEIKSFSDIHPKKLSKKVKSVWDMSALKGLVLLNFAVEKSFVSPSKLSLKSYGDSRPLYPNDTEKNRRRNRRFEIVFEGEIK